MFRPLPAVFLMTIVLVTAPELFAAPPASPPVVAPAASTQPTTRPTTIDDSIARGVKFLVGFQNPDGSWGTGTETRGTEIMSMVPGSHDAFRIGTSALCVLALREAGEKSAHDKGLEYLLTCEDARRDDGVLLYNTWAHIYMVHTLAIEMRYSKDPRIEKVLERNIKEMDEYATYMAAGPIMISTPTLFRPAADRQASAPPPVWFRCGRRSSRA